MNLKQKLEECNMNTINNYLELFIIASDPDYKSKWILTQEEQDFIELVIKLRYNK